MTLREVLTAQGNLKAQGMARRPMPWAFRFPSFNGTSLAALFLF